MANPAGTRMARFSGSTPRAASLFSVVDWGAPPARDCSPLVQTSRSFRCSPIVAWIFSRTAVRWEGVEYGLAIILDDASDMRGPLYIEPITQTANRRPRGRGSHFGL
jgi:hypothetical protein